MKRAAAEIEAAEKAGKLSTPAKYEEVRQHLPYIVACIKEGLRLNPPATNLFGRVTPNEGTVIDGYYIPAGLDVTSYAYVVHRDTETYGPDAEAFRPERWLESESPTMLDSNSFVFGMGARICLGKDIAIMELYKLVTEVCEFQSFGTRVVLIETFLRLFEISIWNSSTRESSLLPAVLLIIGISL